MTSGFPRMFLISSVQHNYVLKVRLMLSILLPIAFLARSGGDMYLLLTYLTAAT